MGASQMLPSLSYHNPSPSLVAVQCLQLFYLFSPIFIVVYDRE